MLSQMHSFLRQQYIYIYIPEKISLKQVPRPKSTLAFIEYYVKKKKKNENKSKHKPLCPHSVLSLTNFLDSWIEKQLSAGKNWYLFFVIF